MYLVIKVNANIALSKGYGNLIIELCNEFNRSELDGEWIIFQVVSVKDETNIDYIVNEILSDKIFEIEGNRIIIERVDVIDKIIEISYNLYDRFTSVYCDKNLLLYTRVRKFCNDESMGTINHEEITGRYINGMNKRINENVFIAKQLENYETLLCKYVMEGRRVISMESHSSPKMFLLNLYEDVYRDMKRDDKINFLNKYIDIFEGIEFDRLRELKSSIDEFKSKYTM